MGSNKDDNKAIIKAYHKHIEVVEKSLFIIASKFLEPYTPERDVDIIKGFELLIRKGNSELFKGK